MPETVEVLVVSYGSAAIVSRLLDSLAEHLPGVPVALREHSADPEALAQLRVVAARYPAASRVEFDPTNPGFGAGCNALAAGSGARFLAFMNPDTELVSWPWTEASPPARAVIGPLMNDDAHQHYGRRYRIRDEVALSWLRRHPPRPNGDGYVSGAAMLIDRESFELIGGFDPKFFLFYEDIDLCIRANAAKIPTLIAPGWTMRHGRHHSTADRFGQSLLWSFESALRYYRKHGSPVWAYRLYKVVDATARAALHAVRRTGKAGAYLALARRAVNA